MAVFQEHTWEVREPITQEKMNRIEKGITEAVGTAESANSLAGQINTRVGELSTLNSEYVSNRNSIVLAINSIGYNANRALQTVADATEGATEGSRAWGQISPLVEYDSDTNTFSKTLANRILDDEGSIAEAYNYADQVFGLVDDARKVGTILENGQNVTAGSLAKKIADIDRKIGLASQTANGASTLIEDNDIVNRLNRLDSNLNISESPYTMSVPDVITELKGSRGKNKTGGDNTSLDARLDFIDGGGNAPSRTLPDVITEIDGAHRAGVSNDTLDKRLDDIDNIGDVNNQTHQYRITQLENEMSGARSGAVDLDARLDGIDTTVSQKVAKADIQKNLTYSTDDDTVLQARQGKLLKDEIDTINDKIGGSYTSSSTIDSAIQSLDARLDAIDGGNALTGNDLATRVSSIESEINAANGNGTLDDRFDTIEANISTIAGELAMVDGTSIVDTNTRVDTLENDLRTMAAELNMLDGTAIVDTNTRIDTIDADLNTASTGIKARLDAIDNTSTGAIKTLQDTDTELDARLDAIDGGTALTGTNLVTRVTNLENKDEIISKPVSGSNYTNDLPNSTAVSTPVAGINYLIQADDDKYYYWRYINNNWELISGGGNSSGGTGNTSGFDLTRAQYDALTASDVSENTDYYVMETNGLVRHYRYIPNAEDDSILDEIEIGQIIDTNKIKRYNIATSEGTVDGEDVTYLNLYQYDYDELNNNIDTERTPLTQIILPKGGGGGASSGSVNKLIRIGDQTIQKIVGNQVLLRVFYSSWDSSGTESSSGNYVLKAGNTTIDTGTFNSGAADADLTQGWKDNTVGYYQFDVTDYCSIGNTSFTLAVTVNNTTLGKSWTTNIVDLHLESTAPEVLLINSSESYNFPYTPFGALSKTLHVIVDDDTEHEMTVALSSITSGRAAQVTIPAQDHGAHKIELYLEATIGGVLQQTESIIREYIWYDAEDDTTILASPKNGLTITAQQYSTIEIPYQVYQKDADTITLEYYIDNAVTPFDTITLEDANTGTLSYFANTQGSHTVTIKVANEDVSITVNLNITELNIDISPISGAIIDFDPTMLTNSSTNRLPSWTVGNNTYQLTASNNFNWSEDASGGGYKNEPDGKCFVIKAGTYVDLDYPMFAGNGSNNILTNGAEMKIIFKTEAVRDINAVWFQNTGTLTDKTVGIQLGAHYGWLKTDKATDTTTTSAGSEYDAWASGNTYAIDDIVLYKDVIYKCIKLCVDHTNIIPGSNDAGSYWTLLEGDNIPSDTSDIEEWTTGTEYAKDTIISYNNAYYKCKKDVINEITTNPKTATDNWLSMGKIDTEVLATNSYLYFPYSEEDKIELDININKYSANSDTNFIMSYEDGVPSKAYAYEYGAAGDGLYHSNTIRIGSNDCDVYIYRLRIYNKSLDTDDILQNFIADGNGINEKVSRYNRNCIYWDSTQEKFFTSPSATAFLDPIKLAERMPDVKILMLDTPTFTTGKKNFVYGSNLRCLQADGGTVYPSRGDADNWFFQNGFHAGQGTTSDNYGQSARNVDFIFIADGTNYPAKKKNMSGYTPSNEYVSSVLIGKDASTWNGTTWEAAREATENEICDNWMSDKCKVSLTETSVPNNFFNLKVNVASSENVNNALFQKRYDDFLTYNSPAQTAQIAKHRTGYTALGMNPNKIKVKNDMEFIPAVLFVRENDTTQDGNGNYTKHNEFNDTNWHFYALGNIGDSKKTDYTRAYDPDDMNEFTCENSDNNTNNGQFQSGVFTYQGHRAIETPYEAYDNEKTYQEGDIVVNEGTIQIYDGSTWSNATLTGWTDETTPYFAPFTAPNPMEYVYPITSSEWNVKIDDNYVNYKHYTLVTEEFDGDHSFEFRYACRGDYRDGDLINESDGQDDDAQFNLNHDVMLAFYEWLITSTEEQYAAEAPQWFVKSAMEFFYAFTHYYTMMDNRAKNTFWHFAKTGNYIEVSRPVKELLHVYEESSDNGATWAKATGTTIDPNKKYRTQYAFDLWTYDCDTAVGIDNNGALVFPYGKEDTDYRTEGDPLSGYAFNGAGSIFWRRLRTTFASEIVDTMSSANVNCFNSQDLIDEFDKFQNCFPEEIWRLDIERKYIRTFTGESIDNSVTTGKQNPRFLTSMMQGRKKYQRRQWVRDQGVYFNSKYRLADITSNSNTIEFNCTTPANIENIALAPSYYLQLTPYQDMYLNVQVGNGNYKDSYITPDGSKNLRAKAGQTYTFNLSGNYQETRIYINGANHLSAIGNLAAMYPYSFDLRALAHIKTLNIGTDVSGYVNTKFTELKLPTYMPLLETLNIKNCHSVAGTIGLSTANNIRTVETTGTAITGVSLPDYTNIETLHIPSTVTALSLYGARKITDFKIYDANGNIDYEALYKLHLYDSDYSNNIDWLDIAAEMLRKQSLETEISFLKLSAATINGIDTMEQFANFKDTLENAGGILNFTGTINVTGEWSTVERDYYGKPNGIWPNLEFDTTNGTEVTRYKVVYKYDSSTKNGEEIYTTYITPAVGSDTITIPEIYTNQPGQTSVLSTAPSKDATKENYYVFGTVGNNGYYNRYSGWRLTSTGNVLTSATATISINSIENNTVTVETIFNSFPMSYPINWYLNENDVTPAYTTGATTVEYGKNYNGHIPTVQDLVNANKTLYTMNISGSNVTYKIFNGWATAPMNLTLTDAEAATDNPAYKIYAQWRSGTNVPLATIRDSAEYTPEKLLLFSQSSALRTNEAYFSTNKRFDITMGYEGVPGGTLITPFESGGSQYIDMFSGDDPYPRETTVSPLTSSNNAFTLVLDYQFDTSYIYADTISEAVLAGCYEKVGNAVYGFRLYFDPSDECVRIGFGDTLSNKADQTKILTDGKASQYRNIIVLRHAQDDPTLYIYSGIRFNSGQGLNNSSSMQIFDNLDADGFVQTLSWSNISTNARLIFGALSSGALGTNQITNARGKIYWAKYWDQDIGAGECRMLAAWPHETMTFGVEDYVEVSNGRIIPTPVGITQPNIILTALSTSQYIGPVYKTLQNTTYANGDIISWNNSWYRNFSNSRIFFGLPVTLQSIISKTTSISKQLQYSSGIFTILDSTVNSTDYVFLPSYAEVDRSSNTYNSEANRVYSWNINSRATVYTYDSNNGTFSTSGSNDGTKVYMNLRFPYQALGLSNRIFSNYSGSSSVYSIIPNITRGDIFIKSGENVAFIYVDETDLVKGAPVVPNSGIFTCSRGGWIRAENWWLRSVFSGPISQLSYGAFMFNRPNGNISGTQYDRPSALSNYNSAQSDALATSAQGACIVYSFGV